MANIFPSSDRKLGISEDSVKKFYKEVIPHDYDEMTVPKQIRNFWEEEDRMVDDTIDDGSSVLDVGCGTGRHLAFLKRKGCHVVGLDYSKEMMEIAKEKVKNVEILLADMREIPLSENSFDYAICMFSTLGNVETGKDKALKEMRRVARKEVVFSVYKESAKEKIKDWYGDISLHIKKEKGNTVHLEEGLVSHFFPKQELKDIIPQEDYKVKECEIGYIITLEEPKH